MHYAHQDGRAVFKRAVVGMADAAAEIMERNGLTADDVRYLVPHQANLRIIDATARRMGLGEDKVMLNIERYGNTTARHAPALPLRLGARTPARRQPRAGGLRRRLHLGRVLAQVGLRRRRA